jgi:hypothetical protein
MKTDLPVPPEPRLREDRGHGGGGCRDALNRWNLAF